MIIPINTAFVEQLVKTGDLKHLAVFIRLKSLFGNSCVFNPTYNTLSRHSGMSPSFLKKHIPFFKAMGWVRIHHGNMVFENIARIDGCRIKNRLEIELGNWKLNLKRLKLLLVRKSHDQFEYIKKLSSDHKNPGKLSDHKAALKAVKKGRLKKFIRENERFSISTNTVGSLIRQSQSSGHRLMKFGREDKILETKYNYVEVRAPGLKEHELREYGLFVAKNKNVLMQKANFVTFL